ncbi:BsuBI/PstI restriction endonuclease C-terminus [Chryseobacterium oranimense]|uniref:BsuBI/PstI restriction endonuclease C-terminus n=1 Tax=Chryseobacterium oranimense TaxID=421058 RepID=A0A1M5UM53_9FLAO|nr:BsuBI/PstI family type II restriction endonuclease [Chryseobacterium oranimense]SHH63987.1 BsuBI/PstI restriction endonuclease C-terminus [Chryseobacterium oranimense]
MSKLPPYVTRELIHERLPIIFPEGTTNRNYIIREMAASTIFTMLYIGAVEGEETFIGPVHVYRMTTEQSTLADDESRKDYGKKAMSKGFQPEGKRWYADNTREPIRDETLREGLIQVGAVISKVGLPTTSSRPRYALQKDFAKLFDPDLLDEELDKAIKDWQDKNLSAAARTRISLASRTADENSERVLVTFPNGEARNLSAGLSSIISKAVVEVFAHKFLKRPAVLWLSTSDAKVTFVDDVVAKAIGLDIEADKNLPDVILADLGTPEPLLIFIEVVATDGPISERRKSALYEISDKAGFDRKHIVFVTAYRERQVQPFRKTIPDLAWGSFAWFMSEPEHLIFLSNDDRKLFEF